MAMSKKAKIWLIVLAIPVVLVIAGIVVLKMMFTSERLKAEVIPRMEEATGRSVTIHDVSLGVFPSIALNMDSVRISNRVGEGFSDAPMLTLDGLRVNVKLFPLLGGRVEATSLELDRPNILIEINKKFETNYEDLVGETEAAPEETPPADASPPAALALLVSGFRITDGTLEYLNRADNSATRLYGVDIDADVAAEEGKILITGDASTENFSYGTLETPMVEGLRMVLASRIAYDMANDVATFEEGDLMVQNIPLTLAGTMSDLQDSTMLDLTVGSDNVNIAELMSLVPGKYREEAESVQGKGAAQIHIKIKGTSYGSAKPVITGTIRASGASLQYADLPKPITNINITSDFYRSTRRQEFRVEKLTANLGESPISMAMKVVDFEDPSLHLTANGSLDLATVKDYYPLEEGTELSGRMKANIRLNGRVSNPDAMKAAGTMEFANVTAKTPSSKHPVRNLNGTVTFNNQVMDSRNLSMELGRSDLSLAFRLVNYLSVISDDAKAPKARADLTLRSRQLFVDDLMGDEAGENEGAVSGTPGRPAEKSGLPLPGVDMNLTANIGTLTTEKFVFKNLRGKMTIAGGVINMQNLTCNTLGGSVNAKGMLNMQNPDRPLFDLALGLNALQANSLLSNFTSFGQRVTGSMTMNTVLKGALDDTLGLIPAALGGKGDVAIKDGSLQGFKVNQSLASMLNLSSLESVAFKDWTNAFSIEGGRLLIKNLKIAAVDADYVVNGSHGLDGTLDYKMALYLPPEMSTKVSVGGFAGEAVNLFKDESGRLKFDFNVGGSVGDPKVQLDTGPAKKRAEELAKRELEKTLKGEAENILDKLFKKKP
jgi:hypothetical protein